MQTAVAPRMTPRIVLGLLVAGLGVLFMLNNLGLLELRHFWRYWPVLLIVVGGLKMLQPGSTRVAGVLLVGLGTAWLLDSSHVLDVDLSVYWPLGLVLAGVAMLWGGLARGRQTPDTSERLHVAAILGSVKRRSSAADFRGGEATALLGGCELDLRDAKIADGEAVLDAFALWGGIDIKVPADWSVDVRGVSILGGFDDETRPATGTTTKRLVVKGFAIMGGVEIVN